MPVAIGGRNTLDEGDAVEELVHQQPDDAEDQDGAMGLPRSPHEA
jgi:hypothetical protein